MCGSSSKAVRTAFQGVRGAGSVWPGVLGAAVGRTLSWLRPAPGRERLVKSAAELSITLILLGALTVLVGRYVGVLGMALAALAMILVRGAWWATRYLAGGGGQQGPVVLVLPGQLIPADGEIVGGTAVVDESARTGASTPVLREPGGECSAVLAGTRILAGRILVLVSRIPQSADKSPRRPP
jgi:hypothetical protein